MADELRGPAARPAFVHRPDRASGIGPFSWRQILVAFAAIGLVGLAFVALTTPLAAPGGTGRIDPLPSQYLVGEPTEGLRPGDRAPEFSVTRPDGTTFQLADLDGRPVRLADLRGKAVWVNFWATWCPPCQAETPILRAVYERYRDRGLVLVGISVQESSVEDVRRYAERYELSHTIATDPSADVFHLYRVYGLPTQFFIDPQGVIRAVVQGPVSEASASRLVESILPAGG